MINSDRAWINFVRNLASLTERYCLVVFAVLPLLTQGKFGLCVVQLVCEEFDRTPYIKVFSSMTQKPFAQVQRKQELEKCARVAHAILTMKRLDQYFPVWQKYYF